MTLPSLGVGLLKNWGIMYSTPQRTLVCGSGVSTQTTRGRRYASDRVANRLILKQGEVTVLISIKVKISGKEARGVSLVDAAATLMSVPWCENFR